MERDEIFKEVCKIVAYHFKIDISTIQPNSEFVRDFNADSVDIVTLVFLLEDKFGIILDYNQGLYSISNTVDIILSKQNHE